MRLFLCKDDMIFLADGAPVGLTDGDHEQV